MVIRERFDEKDWRESGACRTADTAVFFPVTDDEAGPAKVICSTCPVREECLTFALANREEQGVWGGLTETERRRVRRRKANVARSRPRHAA